MPTYDYACSACRHRFERFESIHDDASKACPKCGKKRARRMLGTGAGFIFKGSGFYATDSKPSAKGAGDADKPAGDKEKKAEASGEKKSEKKEEKEPKK